MRPESCIRTGALLAGLAVGLGAFAAHAMQDRFAPDQLAIFETGVRYHFGHALAIVLCGALGGTGRRTGFAAAGLALGITLFSGSLYLMVWFEQKWLGMVTPLGGVAFLVGWVALAFGGSGDNRPLKPTADPA
jgi:uncharacterized membrane protein YgdD (TMEM256/DUF423 family)